MGPHIGARRLLLLGSLAARAALTFGGPVAWAHGRIEKLVGAASSLALLDDRTVAILDGEGRVISGCAALSPAPERRVRRPVGALDADEALALVGLADDDDSTDAEDALADEGLRSAPRRVRATAGLLPPYWARDLAILPSGETAFVATTNGIYRASSEGCVPAGLAGQDVVAIAAGSDAVAIATETMLWRMDPATSVITVAGGLPHRPRTLAVAQGGRIFVADDEGVLQALPGADPVRILERPTEALAYCDDELFALADDGVYVESGGAVVRVGDRPPVRTLACGGPTGSRVLAAGVGLWTSNDGRTWTEHPNAIGHAVGAAAAAGSRLWAAVDGELVLLEDGSPPPVVRAPLLRSVAVPGASRDRLGARTGLIRPTFPWPYLTVAFTAEQAPARAKWSVLVLLTFPLERRSATGPAPAELGADLAQRDADLAEEQIALAARAADDDEATARARALDEERTALR